MLQPEGVREAKLGGANAADAATKVLDMLSEDLDTDSESDSSEGQLQAHNLPALPDDLHALKVSSFYIRVLARLLVLERCCSGCSKAATAYAQLACWLSTEKCLSG